MWLDSENKMTFSQKTNKLYKLSSNISSLSFSPNYEHIFLQSCERGRIEVTVLRWPNQVISCTNCPQWSQEWRGEICKRFTFLCLYEFLMEIGWSSGHGHRLSRKVDLWPGYFFSKKSEFYVFSNTFVLHQSQRPREALKLVFNTQSWQCCHFCIA